MESTKSISKEIKNDFEQSLMDAGFRIYEDNLWNSLRLFQKAIKDDKGIKYYLNVNHYNIREQLKHPDAPDGDTYQARVQFTVDNATVNLNFSGKFTDNEFGKKEHNLDDAIKFFDRFFDKFNCEYYEKED